jgi:hypothetical protein
VQPRNGGTRNGGSRSDGGRSDGGRIQAVTGRPSAQVPLRVFQTSSLGQRRAQSGET